MRSPSVIESWISSAACSSSDCGNPLYFRPFHSLDRVAQKLLQPVRGMCRRHRRAWFGRC